MELRHLRYFVAVAEELHFRRAGERLHVAQPAVSEQVRKLELELGVTLFDRTQRSVSLTTAGTALLREARHVLRYADVAQQAARTAHDHPTMRLRIGYLPDSLPPAVPRALRQLAAAAPRVQVDFETGSALRLIEAVSAQRLDAVITNLPAPTIGLRMTPLGHQRAVAVLPASHRHARDSSIALDILAPERLIVLPRDANPAFYNAIVSICHVAGLSPTLVETDAPRVEDALLAVAAGAGTALLPESAAERYTIPGIRSVPLETAEPAFQSAVLTHPDADNPATFAFLRALAQAGRLDAADVPRPIVELADEAARVRPANPDGESGDQVPRRQTDGVVVPLTTRSPAATG
jgi:DNA-binding transcriptional LysR family regulator